MGGLKKILLAAVVFATVNAQWNSRQAMNNNFMMPGASQQIPQQWGQQQLNRNGHRQQPYHRRQQNLVDYPFTIEYVDRRRHNSMGFTAASRNGIRPALQSQHNDDHLVDYPFTIEYVNNIFPSENQKYMGQASLHSNQDLFQFAAQQQRYLENHHHRYSANLNSGSLNRVRSIIGGSRFGVEGSCKQPQPAGE